jgi:predicted GNAT family N-acyltransferase
LSENGLEVRPARDEEEVEAAKALRLRVFAGEQGISPDAEIDGLDPEATHIVALRNGEVVATCRLRFPRGGCKLERMVVERNLRETGIGTKLVEEAEREAVRQESVEMVLHAQRAVEGFYASCGYTAEGGTFLEEGIEHVKMRKPLLDRERRSGSDRRQTA